MVMASTMAGTNGCSVQMFNMTRKYSLLAAVESVWNQGWSALTAGVGQLIH
jgi:hypothetical protein